MITPEISTISRRTIRPTQPDQATIDPADIAAGLSRRYRFNGQADRPLTVAQHSLAVADRLPPKLQLWGLLHDATEAYLPDLARPLWPVFMVYLPYIAQARAALAYRLAILTKRAK